MTPRRAPRLIALALLPLLAGCFPRPSYTSLPDADSIRIETRSEVVAVADPANPSRTERAAITMALEASGPTKTRVRLFLPTGWRPPDEGTVRAWAGGLGIPPGWMVLVPHAPIGVTPLVEILHIEAKGPDCSKIITPNEAIGAEQRPRMSLGCATYGNLAAQVADPGDLAQPMTFGGATATTASDAVERYLADKVKQPPSSGVSRVGTTGSSGGGSQ